MNIIVQKAGMQETMTAMARKRKIHGLLRGQKGVALIEVLVAITILGVVAVGFLSALTTAYGAVIVADRHTKAESLTRMAGAIAHHFNNQLQAVIGNLELALDKNWREDSVERLEAAMQAAGKAATGLSKSVEYGRFLIYSNAVRVRLSALVCLSATITAL